MKRCVAFLLLAVGLALPAAGLVAPAQGGAGAKKVTVTLVRWPYT